MGVDVLDWVGGGTKIRSIVDWRTRLAGRGWGVRLFVLFGYVSLGMRGRGGTKLIPAAEYTNKFPAVSEGYHEFFYGRE